MSTIKSIKVILTKAGTEYDATKEYKLHDYIVVGGSVMYICKRVDESTMTCKGHSLDETDYWDKSVDLSGWVSEAETATSNANSATEAAKTATAKTETATSNADTATANAEAATTAAKTATSNAEAATTAAKTATSNAEAATTAAKTATSNANSAAEAATTATSALASLLPYVEDECSFGVEFDTSVSSPTCTRIGSTDLHKSLPVQSRMKGCLLDDNGNVVEYLNPTDWTSNVRDGSRGQVMVEIPMHYRKFETDGTKRRVRISELPLEGYHCVPKMYVSAYQATVDRTTSTLKLASVVNTTAAFRGGSNNATYDGTYRTFLGLPATQISRTNFRTYARNRNAKATSEWNCMTYDAQKALYWLFVVEYATLNSQASFNAQLTSEGFHQGGLGNGVTDFADAKWGNYNGYCPLIACGCTDSLGNTTGVVSQTVANDDETIKRTFSVPRYRGIENPFGHVWQWTDGINVRVGASEENGGTGLSEVFVCSDPSKFNDSNYDGYSHVGNEVRVGGYIKEMIFGEYGEIIPLLAGGGSTTYFCDNHYTSIPTSGSALCGVRFGGSAVSGAYAGFVFSSAYHAPSYTYTHIGSRLCFHPSND